MRIGFTPLAITTILIPAGAIPGSAAMVKMGSDEVPYINTEEVASIDAVHQARADLAKRLQAMIDAQKKTLRTRYGTDRLVQIRLTESAVLDGFLWAVEYRPDNKQLVCQVELHTFEGPDEALVDGNYSGVRFTDRVTEWPIYGISMPPDEGHTFDWSTHRNVWTPEPPQSNERPRRKSK
ncbi:MAG: hypothetical protein RJB39_300 [Candidatus Parcubacteria bacterium]|jgi:hypothetical protein